MNLLEAVRLAKENDVCLVRQSDLLTEDWEYGDGDQQYMCLLYPGRSTYNGIFVIKIDYKTGWECDRARHWNPTISDFFAADWILVPKPKKA